MSRVLMLVEGPTERAIVEHIELDKIRQECPHFDEWITKLEQLA